MIENTLIIVVTFIILVALVKFKPMLNIYNGDLFLWYNTYDGNRVYKRLKLF